MGRVEKIYTTVLPVTTEEYAVGQQYVVVSMTEAESVGDFRVELLESTTETHEVLGKVNKTHKVMHLKSKIPSMLQSFIPEDACIVEEIAYNAGTRFHTVYRNRYFSHDTFNMAFHTVNRDGCNVLANPFGYRPEHVDGIERISLDLHENIVNPDFDPSTYYHEESRRGRLQKDWVQAYRDSGMPMMVCHKHLVVEINNFAMGWVSDEIEKIMRNIVASVQQRIFCTMDKWYGRSVDEVLEKHGSQDSIKE